MVSSYKAAAVAITVSLLLVARAEAQPPSDTVFSSVVRVVVRGSDSRGNPVPPRFGSGFVVGPNGAVVTSLHTVLEPDGGWGMRSGIRDVQISVVLRDVSTGLLGTDQRPALVRHSDPIIDVAVLDVAGTARSGLNTCPEPTPRTGDRVVVAGAVSANPLPIVDTRDGAVPEQRTSDAPFIRVSATTVEGFSGGPAFLRSGDGTYTLFGMLKGGDPTSPGSHSLIVPLSSMRLSVLGPCDVPCGHPDHGIARYRISEDSGWQISDWQRGDSSGVHHCDQTLTLQQNSHPGRQVTVTGRENHEFRWFTGWRDGNYIVREAQYKYRCRYRYEGEPEYNVRVSRSCPLPSNPLNLPR